MTEQMQKEMEKSFAYGMSAEEVSGSYNITIEEACAFKKEHAEAIKERAAQLRKDGWM